MKCFKLNVFSIFTVWQRLCKSIQFAESGSCVPQVKIWFQNRRMKWRNSREKESTYTRPPMERLMLWSQSEPADKTHTHTTHTLTHTDTHSHNTETRWHIRGENRLLMTNSCKRFLHKTCKHPGIIHLCFTMSLKVMEESEPLAKLYNTFTCVNMN